MNPNDTVIVKIIGLADPAAEHELHAEHAGRYLVAYDPYTAAGERPRLTTSPDRSKARRFHGLDEFHKLFSTAYGIRPWDGKPNRPLTAFNCEVIQADA